MEKQKKQFKFSAEGIKELFRTNDMVRLGSILFAITLVVSLLLAAVNGPTSVAIAKQNEEKTKKAMEGLFAGATFEKAGFTPTGIVSDVYGAYKDGALIGKVVFAAPTGFGGAISMIVGIDAENKVTGVEITDMKETPNLGTKTKDAAFKDQFKGKTGALVVKKSASADNEITAISGATISSTAVTNGVSAALEAAASVK